MPRSRTPRRTDAKIGLALEANLQEQPDAARAELERYISTLSTEIKNVGRISSLEILWAIGRIMNNG